MAGPTLQIRRARAEELRRWKSISKSVSRQMQMKYGEER